MSMFTKFDVSKATTEILTYIFYNVDVCNGALRVSCDNFRIQTKQRHRLHLGQFSLSSI